MKKYLRMSDVFDMQPIRLPASWSYEMVAHAVHAIDIHDELVEMNKDLLAALEEGRRAIGEHFAPNDCYATGPMTGDEFRDLVQCPACSFIAMYDHAIAKAKAAS